MDNIVIIILFLIFITVLLVLYYLFFRKGETALPKESAEYIRDELCGIRSREIQANLLKLKKREKPFDGVLVEDFRVFDAYDGMELGLFVNGIRIGNISKENRDFFIKNKAGIKEIKEYGITRDKGTNMLKCEIVAVLTD